jgi:hypothetical protein
MAHRYKRQETKKKIRPRFKTRLGANKKSKLLQGVDMGTSATRLKATEPPSNPTPGLGDAGPQEGSGSNQLMQTAMEPSVETVATELAESESAKGYIVLNEIAREFRKDFVQVDKNDFPGDY